MKNRTLLAIALILTAGVLFFIGVQRDGRTVHTAGELSEAPLREVEDESWALVPTTAVKLQYTRYPMSLVYFVVFQESIPVYLSPNDDKRVVRRAKRMEKLQYLETVRLEVGGRKETWYHVYWYVDGGGELTGDGSLPGAERRFGFIAAGSAEKRQFHLDAMAESVQKAESFCADGQVTRISNYKDGNGMAPLYKGTERDKEGNLRSQSAPGYEDPSSLEEFTYLPDGALVKILGTEGRFRKVLQLHDEKVYYVPKQYVPQRSTLEALEKAVVIDRKNQNEAVFEKTEEGWTVVSYTLATTGAEGEYAVPTPLGCYEMIQKRPQFYYYRDGTTEVAGYAPFVLRFCGGAYIHGVPVSYRYENGKGVTPPAIEYSPTMGTLPLSHKCVRNYTSHAEFLWNWFEPGRTAVIVME